MVSEADARAAASVKPSLRTDAQNAALSGSNSQAVRNAMHKAAQDERTYGAKK